MTNQMNPKYVWQELKNFINSIGLSHISHELFYTRRHKNDGIGSDKYIYLCNLYEFDDDYDYWFQVRFYDGINKKMVIGNRMHYYNGEVLKPSIFDDKSIEVTIRFNTFKLDDFVSLFNNEMSDDIILVPKRLNIQIEQIKKEYNLILLSKKI